MSSPDRSWTITPTWVWFGAFLVAGLLVLDGDLHALADRLTVARTAGPAAGPAIAAPAPPRVAQADDNDDNDRVDLGGSGGGGSAAAPATTPRSGGALDDTCLDPVSAPAARGGTPDACKRWAMDSFYKSVASSKKNALGRPVRVSWYGDSVVATDQIPGHLRARMQEALGDGGPGFVFVVAPHRYCDHEAITRTNSGHWDVRAISTAQVADGLYGPAGTSAEATEGADATIKVSSGKVQNVELYYLAQPHGGTATIVADGKEVARADTAADKKQPGFATASVAGGVQKLELTTRGRVRMFGVDLENASGAVVDNLGIVSVRLKSFAANDTAHWTDELGHRGADLIMIMIGANEAEWLHPGDKDTKDYQGQYEALLARVRKGAPSASCLVVSPTDQAEAVDGDYRSRPVMPYLVDAQRKAAHAAGCAFYSTYDWMGGKGSAMKWLRKGWINSDFQHLTKNGANKMADAVFDALMAGYRRYAHE